MDDGIRVSVDGKTVTIFQNCGDPDYPADEFCIKMTADSFRKIVAITEVAFGVKRQKPAAATEHFAAFWGKYPKKVSKEAAIKAWSSVGGDKHADEIMQAIEVMAGAEDWRKDGGKFIPHASTWLNGRRWQDVVEQESDLGVFK